MKVYIARWGQYSDTGIIGVFANREDAEAVVAARNRHAHEYLGYGVTEYEVQGGPLPTDRYFVHVDAFEGEWTVSEDLAPRETNPDYIGRDFYDDGEFGMHSVWVEVDPAAYDVQRDRDRMAKIAQDRLAQWKAERAEIA